MRLEDSGSGRKPLPAAAQWDFFLEGDVAQVMRGSIAAGLNVKFKFTFDILLIHRDMACWC